MYNGCFPLTFGLSLSSDMRMPYLHYIAQILPILQFVYENTPKIVDVQLACIRCKHYQNSTVYPDSLRQFATVNLLNLTSFHFQ